MWMRRLSPLLGDLGGLMDHPSEDNGAKKPSEALVGASEARGRSSRNKQPDKKKVKKTLKHLGSRTQQKDRRTYYGAQKPKKESYKG